MQSLSFSEQCVWFSCFVLFFQLKNALLLSHRQKSFFLPKAVHCLSAGFRVNSQRPLVMWYYWAIKQKLFTLMKCLKAEDSTCHVMTFIKSFCSFPMTAAPLIMFQSIIFESPGRRLCLLNRSHFKLCLQFKHCGTEQPHVHTEVIRIPLISSKVYAALFC